MERGWGVNILEDARQCSVLYIRKYFVTTRDEYNRQVIGVGALEGANTTGKLSAEEHWKGQIQQASYG